VRRDNGTGSVYFEHKAGTEHHPRGSRGDIDNGRYHKGCTGRWIGKVDLGRDGSGKRVRKPVTAPTRELALAKMEEVRRQADVGVEVDTRLTVAQALDSFIEQGMVGRAPKSVEARTWDVKLLEAELGATRLHELTARQVEAAFARIARTHSTETMRKVRSTLVQTIRRVQVMDKLERNVAEIVPAPPGQIGVRRRLAHSVEEMLAILDAAHGYRNMDAACHLGFGTGARPDELRGLHWAEVDLDGAVPAIYIIKAARHSGMTKGEDGSSSGSRRAIALPQSAVESLRRHRVAQTKDRLAKGSKWVDNDLVFTTLRGTQVNQYYFRKAYRAVLRKAGIPDAGRVPYEMRHSFASMGSYAGLTNDTMAELMGHRRTTTFEMVYKHDIRPVPQQLGASAMDAVMREARGA
jgi:integrase